MATSGTLTIKNLTGVTLTASDVTQLNDDAKFSGIANGDTIAGNGGQVTIAMSNNSIVFAPRGVGVEVTLSAQNPTRQVTLHLDIPAVGAHTLSYRDATNMSVAATEDPDNNSYTQVLT